MTEDKNKNQTESKVIDAHLNNEIIDEVASTVQDENKEDNLDERTLEEKEQVEEVIDMKSILTKKKEMLENIKRLENENSAFKERLARISAEYDNYRKRTQKEKEGIYSDSVVEVVKELLPAIDNLEASLKVEAADLETIRKGVSMTLNQFSDAFKKLKISEIDTEIPFDPNFHDAVMHVEDPAYQEKQIVQVFLKGYQREDKIIRYSVVQVAN